MGATFSDDTRELLGMLGELHDFLERYVSFHERTTSREIEDADYERVCTAVNPAIVFFENLIATRLDDFFSSLSDTTI